MTTRTNYLSLMALDKVYTPETEGFVNKSEAELIRKELELKQRTDIELNDIRDMTVLFFDMMGNSAREEKNVEKWRVIRDKSSAIVCIIDNEKIRHGMEV
jgi:hypothetical protein